MSSGQLEFLDLSEIGEEDYNELVTLLDDKTAEISLPSSDNSLLQDLKDEEEDDCERNLTPEDGDFISQSKKDDSAAGISFFIDGGTAEDIDPGKTPPMLSDSVTPPQSDSPSTICNDQEDEIPPEEPINMYPHIPQSPYMSQPPPMVPHMNVHNVATSGHIFMPQSYPTPTAPGMHAGMYSHIPHNPAHHQILPHTVHIENCHVNLSPYGNPQAPGALYATPPPPYQGPHHPHVFQQFLLTDQPPMSMQMKPNMDKDYEHKRHDPHSRGGYRGRGGRGRGRRRGRDDHERSNSVSSDHSSYSDSGGKQHYKDNGPTPPTLPPPPHHHHHHYSPLMQYPHYVPYPMNSIPRPHQGYPIMSQFIPNPYTTEQATHVLAYPQNPASVALIPNDAPNHPSRHPECVPIIVPQDPEEHIVEPMAPPLNYIVTTDYEGSAALDSGCQYSYCNVEENINVMSQSIAISSCSSASSSDGMPNNINLVVTCSSNTVVFREEEKEQDNEVTSDPQIDYIESKVSSVKIEVDALSLDSIVSATSPNQSLIIEEIDATEVVPPLLSQQTNNNSNGVTQSTKNQRGGKAANNNNKMQNGDKPVKPVQSKPQNGIQKSHHKVAPSEELPETDFPVSFTQNSLVPSSTQKRIKKNGLSSKSKRKNSPTNKEDSRRSPTPPTAMESASDITFGFNDSITVYNQSLTPALETKEFVKVEEGPSKPKEDQISTTEISKNCSESVVASSEIIDPSSESSEAKLAEPSSKDPAPCSKPSEAAWGQQMCWSQLFKPNEDFSTKQIAFVSPFNAKENNDPASVKVSSEKENGEISYSDSEVEKAKVGALIKTFNPDYRPVLLQPRGLINKNYWCYVNAPLQALLACPSFYQLAKSLSKETGYKSGNLSTPFINSVVDFVSEFNSMPAVAKQSRKDKGANKKEPEVVPGTPFEPTCVYKMLCNYKKNQFMEGRQQDAEEMLSCVLNGLHDEMVESLKLAGGSEVSQNGIAHGDRNGTDQGGLVEDESEWKVQGPKKKSYVTRTAHFNPSPISQIFWGQLRSVLQQAGGNTTASLQPFNTLPLDIQSPKIDTLKDALSQLVTREEISGFTCSKTNQEVTASNQVMFEDLPRVLILQLKRFIYDNGGLQKVTKRLQFPVDLEITKDLISTNSRGRFSTSQRKYKLFAIVNHEGKEANKGHYVADVFHNGYNCWLRYDDSSVKAIPETVVLRHDPPRVPYLLFYRRTDTLTAPPGGGGSTGGGGSNKSN